MALPFYEEDELTLLKQLLARAAPPAVARDWLLDDYCVQDELDALDDRIAFEKGAFSTYGRTEFDRRQHEHHVRPLLAARQKILDAVDEGIVASLKRMTLLGFGLALPVGPASKFTVIHRRLWSVVELQVEKATACGGGYKFYDVRIANLSDLSQSEAELIGRIMARIARTSRGQPEPRRAGAEHPRPRPADEVIRVEIVNAHEIRQPPKQSSKESTLVAEARMLLRERAEAGRLRNVSAKAEFTEIEKLLQARHPNEDVPSWRHLRNELGAAYKQARRESRAAAQNLP